MFRFHIRLLVCVCIVYCVVDSDVSLANSRAVVLAPKTSDGDLIWRWVFPHVQVKAAVRVGLAPV